jgi:uncharacterized Fe-S cluster protein YjdI
MRFRPILLVILNIFGFATRICAPARRKLLGSGKIFLKLRVPIIFHFNNANVMRILTTFNAPPTRVHCDKSVTDLLPFRAQLGAALQSSLF